MVSPCRGSKEAQNLLHEVQWQVVLDLKDLAEIYSSRASSLASNVEHDWPPSSLNHVHASARLFRNARAPGKSVPHIPTTSESYR